VPFLNIVFDLGGVVFDWKPDEIIQRVFEKPETQNLVKRDVFGHPDWVELDRGTLGLDKAIDRAAVRTGLPRTDVEQLFRAVPPSLTLMNESLELIQSIKHTNNKFFVLSNMHVASITYLESKHDFWGIFDGIVISCRIQKVKPELAIYKHLLKQFNLSTAETVFIDDMEQNLAAAAEVGIQTIQFMNPAQCRRDMERLKCI
jgi:putative hydrolase of the HAD superfamily